MDRGSERRQVLIESNETGWVVRVVDATMTQCFYCATERMAARLSSMLQRRGRPVSR